LAISYPEVKHKLESQKTNPIVSNGLFLGYRSNRVQQIAYCHNLMPTEGTRLHMGQNCLNRRFSTIVQMVNVFRQFILIQTSFHMLLS